ncbi:carbon starvation CstA family protein [Marinigracilibium pacificum]|uniref:Carbon starvation protein A n=1 Tax=Marinigracilibium pacificum TaxID=2729599 RepID=A0A848ISR2_9BACT|nr:carbon starvation protein A [Marinigracilibium pacificum]NMM47377.1 carbon starvation protein A [Marinigracilibium pacificum]
MTLLPILIVSAIILIFAYRTYGSFVAKKLKINNDNETPAHTHKDGIDYVPEKVPVVLGHHFASIAGAGPIVGPIIAVTFGWIPAIIWILVGGIFFGAVHDLTSMMASIRHQGKSIGVIIHQHIGTNGKRLFLIFSFATLILIIAVFVDIIAKTFVANPSVATASLLFIIIAIGFGIINKQIKSKTKFIILSAIGVIIMYTAAFTSILIPINLSYTVWVIILMAYAYIASVTPVSFLLQPRDYLSSFLLYGLILFAVIGIMISNPEIKMDTAITLKSESLGYMFPVLFVTIACGAISGFHSLVASGTTSKQIDKEKDAKTIGFGGMLIESFLAILSVGAVIIMSKGDYAAKLAVEGPVAMFSNGMGAVIANLGVTEEFAITFVALTVSAFALTTLDTCTRLARFTFQEFFEDVDNKAAEKASKNRHLATSIVVVLSVLLLLSGEFTTLWPIFGSANQLLAALALLAVSVWLMKQNIKPLFVLIPMYFMFAVTLTSLLLFAIANYDKGIYILSLIAGLLFALSIVLIYLARQSLKKELKTTT